MASVEYFHQISWCICQVFCNVPVVFPDLDQTDTGRVQEQQVAGNWNYFDKITLSACAASATPSASSSHHPTFRLFFFLLKKKKKVPRLLLHDDGLFCSSTEYVAACSSTADFTPRLLNSPKNAEGQKTTEM